ncbi:MAG: hypothetical protein WEC15_00785 [Flavobacteriales bacterium]
MLATIPGTTTIWEPFDQDRNPAFKKLGFWWRQHIPEDASWPEAETLISDLLAGRMLSPYLIQSTNTSSLEKADRLLIKIVRGGMLLPWICSKNNIPKPVLLVRHPCAVIASMLRHGAWSALDGKLPELTPHRYDKRIQQELEQLGPLEGELDMLTAIWCLNNSVPLLHDKNDRAWVTITYEELVMRTEDTLQKIFSAWGMEIPPQALVMARKPSRTSVGDASVVDPVAQLAEWKKKLTPQQSSRILELVRRSGLDLYTDELLPRKNYTE